VSLPQAPVDRAFEEFLALHRSLQEAASSTSADTTSSPAAPEASVPAPLPGEELSSFLCRLATHVWRAKSKMIDPATGAARDDMKRVYRHIEGAVETLGQSGVVLQDWLNQGYDVGLPVKVLSYQPTPGLTRDTILETLRPAVIWNGRMLQLGEVIVGTPPPAQA
jgi:hypothetical protein